MLYMRLHAGHHSAASELRYALDPEATAAPDGRRYVTGVNCCAARAEEQFRTVREIWNVTDIRPCLTGYLSLPPGTDVKPEVMLKLSRAFLEALCGDRWEGVAAVHFDTDRPHFHFAVNRVSAACGGRLRLSRRDVYALQERVRVLGRAYGLDTPAKYPLLAGSYPEIRAEKESRVTVRGQIRADLDRAAAASMTPDELGENLRKLGYCFGKLVPIRGDEDGTSIAFPDGSRAYRLARLGPDYCLAALRRRTAQNERRVPLPAPEGGAPVRPAEGLGPAELYGTAIAELRRLAENRGRVLARDYRTMRLIADLPQLEAEHGWLAARGFGTAEQCGERASELEKKIAESRRVVRNQRDRMRYGTVPDRDAAEQFCREMLAERRTDRRELQMLRRTAARTEALADCLTRLRAQELEEQKEVRMSHEHRGDRGGEDRPGDRGLGREAGAERGRAGG